MPRQIPAGLNWFEAPESAAVRAFNENAAATAAVYNSMSGILYRDVNTVRAELDAIKAAYETSRDGVSAMTVEPLVPELASYTNRNAYYDDTTEAAPVATSQDGAVEEATKQAVIPETNNAEGDDPGSAYKTMVEGEQAESEVKLLK